MVDVDAPSENRAALAARGCDEPGLAAVAGVVAGAAAVAGERCLVAMFAPRPLLTALSNHSSFVSNCCGAVSRHAEVNECLPELLARCGRP